MKNRTGEVPLPELLEMDEKIKNSAIFFHLILDQNVLEKRDERDDITLNQSKLEELYTQYYEMSPVPCEKIDVTGMSPSEIVEEMRRRMMKRRFL